MQIAKIDNEDYNDATRGYLKSNQTTANFNEPKQKEQFILACRYFNRGLAKLALLKEEREQDEFEEEDE